jgi:hypothetical protein
VAAISIRRQRAGRPISTFHSILTLKRRLRVYDVPLSFSTARDDGSGVSPAFSGSPLPMRAQIPGSLLVLGARAWSHGRSSTALWPWGRLALASCYHNSTLNVPFLTGILLSPGPHHDILSLDTPSRHGSHSRRLQEDRSCTSGSIPTIAPIVWLIVTY